MKNKSTQPLALIILIFVSSILIQCTSSNKVVQNDIPFEITEKSYVEWVDHNKGISGTDLKLKGKLIRTNVDFLSVFFRGDEHMLKPAYQGDFFILETRILNKGIPKNDKIMSGNSKEEYGNQAPNTSKRVQDNEAVIRYAVNAKEYYHKVGNIEKISPKN